MSDDRPLRKQLVLTRIAADRLQWRNDVDQLTQAANPRVLAPQLVRMLLGPGWLSQWLAGSAASRGTAPPVDGLAGYLLQGYAFMRRYPILLTLAGSALPWVRARRSVRRLALLVSVGTVVAGLTWFLGSRPPRR